MRETLRINGEALDVAVSVAGDGSAVVQLGGESYTVSKLRREGGALSFEYEGRAYRFHLRQTPEFAEVTDGRAYYRFARVVAGAEAEEERSEDVLTSQMPGTVLKLLVEPGAEVAKGTPLLILEAMKMEHEVCAPSDGTVVGFPHQPDERVMPGDLLVEFTAAE